ncbi:MAG: efflux RND transporter permease subunit, partial [Hyphomicrobiales bacterium]|nr:efflux RND transporter permease subunit [Hyphomicrobiales bacterium]
RVTFEGIRDEEIVITVPERELRRLDLTLSQIADRLAENTRDVPSGNIEGTVEKQIRALSPAGQSSSDFGQIEVKALTSGETIRLRDIASIRRDFDDNAPSGFADGERAIELTIWRTPAQDTLKTNAILDKFLAEVEPTLPPTLEIVKYEVRADRLKERIMLLVKNGAGGLVIVITVLFIFLSGRIALWVAAGIPVAMMATLGVMWAMGQTINMISLFGLIMTLGIIVDDAIVVGEHTDTRYRLGDSPLLAAENGAGRMIFPVIAASTTTMAAFLPILLVRDTIGQIMGALPLVVVAVLAASIVECFFVLPAHLRHGLPKVRREPWRFRRMFDAGFDRFRSGPFTPLVRLSFAWRYTTVALCIGVLILATGFLMGGRVGFVFFPSPEAENLRAEVEFNAGIREEQAIAALRRIGQSLRATEQKLGNGEEKLVVAAFATLGKSGRVRGDNIAGIDVQLTASEVRTIRTPVIVKAWQRSLPAIAGVKRIAVSARRGGPPGRDIDIRLANAAPADLKAAALETAELLSGFPGVSGVYDDMPFGKPELVMELTSRGATLGFTLESVAGQIRNAFEGAIARRLAEGDEEITIRVEAGSDRIGAAQLRDLILKSSTGEFVPLSEVVKLTERQGFSLIQRRDGKVTVSVMADVDSNVTSNQEILARLQEGSLAAITDRYGIDHSFSGREEERKKAFTDLRFGSMIALTVIYIILAWVFGSYTRPFTVILIIPFGIIGAIFGHYLFGMKLTIMSMISLLGLAGILVNDSIVLVSRLDERLDNGDSIEEAAVGASGDRLRAVLLTSLTTIGGLIPMMFEQSRQAQFLVPMVITIVFGLAATTLIVLFLVPAMVGIGHDIGRFFRLLYGRADIATESPAE